MRRMKYRVYIVVELRELRETFYYNNVLINMTVVSSVLHVFRELFLRSCNRARRVGSASF